MQSAHRRHMMMTAGCSHPDPDRPGLDREPDREGPTDEPGDVHTERGGSLFAHPTPSEATRAGSDSRRLSSYVYGLIVGGAVLATAPEEFRLARVAFSLFATLVIYWAAETYVHWIAARTLAGRPLVRSEYGAIVRDGWPLVTACSVPVAFLALEAALRVETALAVDLALGLNAVLLFVVGWRMGRAGHLQGPVLALSAGVAGLLGAAVVLLKIALH